MYTKKFKNKISILLALIMVINLLPLQLLTVHAYDVDKYWVDTVNIFKIYDSNGNFQIKRLIIYGNYLKDADVVIVDANTGEASLLTKRNINTDYMLQFEIDKDQYGNNIIIGNVSIAINEGDMPTLTGVKRRVKEGKEPLIIKGTRLTNINKSNIKAGYEHDDAHNYITYYDGDDNEITVKDSDTAPGLSGALGLQRIIFEKEETKNYTFNEDNKDKPVTISIKYTYEDQFRIYRDIEIEDDKLTMYPNRGQKGDRIYFETPAGILQPYDVFFLKSTDGTDPYTEKNRGKNMTISYGSITDINSKDVLTVEIPDIDVGEYYVVFAYPLTSGADPMKQITMEKILKDKFTVISSNIKAKISGITPPSGPDTGSKATISAQFVGTLNIPEFVPDNDNKTYSSVDNKELKVTYSIGSYKGVAGYTAERKIKILIGDYATFLKKGDPSVFDVDFKSNIDIINILTAQVTDADVNPVKDVIIDTETTIIKTSDSSIVQTVTERAILKNGYTYTASKIKPTIESITPERIQVVPYGNIFKTPEKEFDADKGRLIAINGKNFMIHKYKDMITGKDVIRYPVVEIGSITLDKNDKSNIDIKVLNAQGAELDGSVGNELGTKILVYIPAETPVTEIGKADLKVINPIRNSNDMGFSDEKYDFVEFVNIEKDESPIISSVNPDIVATEGGVEVKVSGSNFLDGIKLFLAGDEVKTIKRSEDGKEITFTAPKGREGDTQLMIMNPDGGAATWLFTYVKTYTNPKISYFAPKSGNTGTLVILKGDNFLQPDPAATPEMIYRLLGTRILLGGKDINDYIIEPATKRIKFVSFAAKSDNPVLQIKEEASLEFIQAADYYNSVVFQVYNSDPAKYYTLNIDGAGKITLTDGINNSYSLEIEGNKIKANKTGGSIYDLEADNNGIVIKDNNDLEILNLIMKTPYKTDIDGDGQKIIGNRVKVVDKNTIHFTIPILEARGYYDVTVLNPDTKRDDKKGTDGFYYYKQPQSNPKIDKVEPNEGTTEGGYSIDIIGEDFDDVGTDKVKVYINGIQVAPENVLVSPDGKTITVQKVPKYPGDLYAEKGTNRYTVPVVAVNPDGGSAVKDDGFTYLVPTSGPEISKITPAKGTAAGGDIVEIYGSDFRFFEPYEDANRNQIRDKDEWYNDINNNKVWDSWDRNEDFVYEGTLPDGTVVTKDWREPRSIVHSRYDTYYASPILPKVFFGDKQAKIVEFARGYLKVISPEDKAGKVDIYVVNNDSGISNKQSFTYESSNPKITRVFPGSGKMQGGDIIELLGTGFARTTMDIYDGTEENGISKYQIKEMAAVRFGSLTNRHIADRNQENSGRIDHQKATIRFPEMNLTVEYNATGQNTILKLIKAVGDELFTAEIKGYDNSVKYIPLNILKNAEGDTYKATGLIKAEVDDRRLLVDTGYSDDVRYMGEAQIFIKIPTYHTIGTNIPIELINPDKGIATAGFEYLNPYDNPIITEIEPINKVLRNGVIIDYDNIPTDDDEEYYTYVSLTGGVLLTIKGSNFKRTAKVYLDDKELQILDRSTNGDRLIVVVPPADESQQGIKKPIFVDNKDGGVVGTREPSEHFKVPYFVVYQKGLSGPIIEKVVPDRTSKRGENIITIIGTDFRPDAKVYIGGIQAEVQEIPNTETIKVKVPLGLPLGKVNVTVQNKDYGADEKKDALTIISSPWIEDVLDENGLSISSKLFSMTGGENIKIKGIDLQDGAQVIFGGQIKEKLEDGETGLQGIDINDKDVYIVGGTVISSAKLEDEIYLNITTPQMREGKISIIVLNKDGGVSQEYTEFEATRPIPDRPTDAKAYAVDGDTIKLVWKGKAERYQIFASFGEKENSKELSTYNYMLTVEPEIADDGRFFYYVKGLMTETWYRFRIIAVNEFGVSKDYAETKKIKTPDTISSEHKYNDEYQNPTNRTDYSETTKDNFIYNIGEKSIKGAGSFYLIELRNKNIKEGLSRQIKIPVKIIQDYQKTYNIWDKDAVLKFENKALNTPEIAALQGIDKNDAAGIIEIYNPTGQRYDDITILAGRRKTIVKTVGIGYKLQKQNKITPIRKLNQSIELTIIMDPKYKEEENLELYYYNVLSKKLEKVAYTKIPGERTIKANILTPGEYILIK